MTESALLDISESSLTPEKKVIFHDIKVTFQIPFVNYIFRHLSTIPNCLECVWPIIKMLFQNGKLWEGVRKIEESACSNCVDSLTNRVEVSLADSDLLAISNVVRFYNYANPLNLVAINVLLHILQGGGRAKYEIQPLKRLPTPKMEFDNVPDLPAIDSLDRETRSLILQLSHGPWDFTPKILPSLYRHLSYWPEFLRAISSDLLYWFKKDSCKSSITAVSQSAFILTGDLPSREMQKQLYYEAMNRESLCSTLRDFSLKIGEMTIVGKYVEKTLTVYKENRHA